MELSIWHLLFTYLLPLFTVVVNSIEFHHTIHGRRGVISSPNYPKHYPLNTTSIWLISVDKSQTIQVNFTNFNLEKNKKCLYDYVFIEETQLGGGSVSRKFCGHKIPPSYVSVSNTIKVTFVSDKFSNVDVGFQASWSEVGGTPLDQFIKPSKPSGSVSSCAPSTVTVSKPCTQIQPSPTAKPSTCSCKRTTVIVTKTVSNVVTVQGVTPTKSASEGFATATVVAKENPTNPDTPDTSNPDTSNKVEPVNRCNPSNPFSLIDEKKQAAERDSSKNLVVSLGVVLVALFITNVFLLVLLCKRERGYNAISFNSLKKYLYGRNRSLQDTPDIFYSSYTRPTLRMVNGEIVVVPPQNSNSTELEHTEVLLEAYHADKQITPSSVQIGDQLPELPFHLIPQQHLTSTNNSGTDENTLASTRTDVLSDTDTLES